MEGMHAVSAKKAYSSPKLVVKGDVSALTQGTCKTFGMGDGYFLIIDSISIKNCS